MSRRRVMVLRAGAATCLAAAALLWLPTSSVSAQTGAGEVEVGWWYRLSGESGPASEANDGGAAAAQTAPPPTLPPSPAPIPTVPIGEDDPPAPPAPVPPAASVPEGGIYVANDSFGPLALGAVRFHQEQVGAASLTLRFASGGGGASLPIVACPLLEGFDAVTNGAWRDRPAHDCSALSVTGTIGSDGGLTFQLTEAFQSADQSTFDAVILPLPGDGTPFSAPFDAVGPDALTVTGGAAPRPTTPTPTTFSVDPDAPAAVYTDTGSRAPSGTVARPGGAGTVTTQAGSGGGGTAADSDSGVPGVETVAQLFDDREWARPVATLLLALMAIGLGVASTGRVPALAGVLHGGGTGEKGIGRFARERHGPPPALL